MVLCIRELETVQALLNAASVQYQKESSPQLEEGEWKLPQQLYMLETGSHSLYQYKKNTWGDFNCVVALAGYASIMQTRNPNYPPGAEVCATDAV